MDARERRPKRQVLDGNGPGILELIGFVRLCLLEYHLWYERFP